MKKFYSIAITLIASVNLCCMNSHETNNPARYTLELPNYTSDDDTASQMVDPLNPFGLSEEFSQALQEKIPAVGPVELPLQDAPVLPQQRTPPPPTKTYKCTQCPHTTKSRNTLITHAIKSHVQPTLECPKCNILLPSRLIARRHIFGSFVLKNPLNNPRQALWDQLQASAKKQAIRLLRLKIDNKTKPREKIACPYPGCKRMIEKRRLTEHIQAQHIKQQILCPDNNCAASYLSWNGLRMHIQSKHGLDRELFAAARNTWNQTLRAAERETRNLLKA